MPPEASLSTQRFAMGLVVVTFVLLAFLVGVSGLIKVIGGDAGNAAREQALMAVVSLVFVALAVRSFAFTDSLRRFRLRRSSFFRCEPIEPPWSRLRKVRGV